MPGPDPTHWLHRLTAAEWLASAETELTHAEEALRRRAARPGVTHARRAAGMAWNALLSADPATYGERFGRSYMEHIVAAAGDEALPAAIRDAAALLRETAPRPPELIRLGGVDLAPLEAARAIAGYARAQVGEKG